MHGQGSHRGGFSPKLEAHRESTAPTPDHKVCCGKRARSRQRRSARSSSSSSFRSRPHRCSGRCPFRGRQPESRIKILSALVADTNFGIHGAALPSPKNQAELSRRRPPDCVRALDFERYADELPSDTCPWNASGQQVPITNIWPTQQLRRVLHS